MPEKPYDPAVYEPDKQRPVISRAEEAITKLNYQAERLLKQGMAEQNTHKHKWATGKEKWEALQLEGQKVAGVVKPRRGRPSTPPPTDQELLVRFITRLELYQSWLISGKYGPMQLDPERLDLIKQRNYLVAQHLLDHDLITISVVVLDPLDQ